MKDYRSLWKKPHLVAAVMAGTAGVLAAAALGYALLGPGAPVSAAGAAGQVQEGRRWRAMRPPTIRMTRIPSVSGAGRIAGV